MTDNIVTRLREAFAEWENGDDLYPDLLLDAANNLEKLTEQKRLWKEATISYQDHLTKHGCDWTTTLASQAFYAAMKCDGATEVDLLRLQVARLEQEIARGKQ